MQKTLDQLLTQWQSLLPKIKNKLSQLNQVYDILGESNTTEKELLPRAQKVIQKWKTKKTEGEQKQQLITNLQNQLTESNRKFETVNKERQSLTEALNKVENENTENEKVLQQIMQEMVQLDQQLN